MLKKIFLFAFLLQTSLSFAAHASSTITIAPVNPARWGYMNASVMINDHYRDVNGGITLPV